MLFRVELAEEAMPLPAAQTAAAKADVPIVVLLSAENDAVAIDGPRETKLPPPESGQPRTGFFQVKGVHVGQSRLAVIFRQGGTDLGIISLAVEVVPAGAGNEIAHAHALAMPMEKADDAALTLLIDQRVEGGQVFYEYTLSSEELEVPYSRVRSKPLLDKGNGAAASVLAFIERIYERVAQPLRVPGDLDQLQREVRALGASLCQELFDPDVVRILWPLRKRITLIRIVSWEPYVPWEMVRLKNPDSDDIDDCFLCEYGMVRTLSEDMPPKVLVMDQWDYLGAVFPSKTLPSVGAELDYFTGTSPGSLQALGIKAKAIAGTRDAFYETLAKGDFDVLHVSCHAEATHQSIERASLIIGETTALGDKAQLVEVDTITVEAEARLRQRRPLVFLNACETGISGPVLTAWGGWPKVFINKGAGAFVGTAWPVRDKPAAAFSTAFYNALLEGKTLTEATNAARAAAKAFGDASWLAFKVYGHPRARRQAPAQVSRG